MKKCDVLELMELQIERRAREEHRLKLDLDSIQDEMNALRISRLQIQAEVLLFFFFFFFFFLLLLSILRDAEPLHGTSEYVAILKKVG